MVFVASDRNVGQIMVYHIEINYKYILFCSIMFYIFGRSKQTVSFPVGSFQPRNSDSGIRKNPALHRACPRLSKSRWYITPLALRTGNTGRISGYPSFGIKIRKWTHDET